VRLKRTHNLYHQTFSQEQALMMPVGELQMKLKLDQHMEQKITLSEMVSFLYWTVIALAISLSPLILLYLVFKLLANLF
jgi:hypothetical protein